MTAERETNLKEDEEGFGLGKELGMARAMEVLPVPGGPQRRREGRRWRLMAEWRREFGERRWSWPTTSSRVRGRIRSDKGWGGMIMGFGAVVVLLSTTSLGRLEGGRASC